MRSDKDFCESVMFSLRSLYGRYGYTRYKMNKFEEYDLYAHNKDFLVSDSVLTFTDGSGKLLALKPDVTLSIVKNTADCDGMKKLYYNENVYRVAKGSRNYKEIMQIGLECIGDIDAYQIYEVLNLASESLSCISPANVLSLSHLGVLSEVMDSCGIKDYMRADVMRCIGEKNLHELSGLFAEIGDKKAEILRSLIKTNGTVDEVLPGLTETLRGIVSEKTLADFTSVMSALRNNKNLRIDFSVIGDINYYNGFVFKGFVEGIPFGVLSGGQYDKLMKKMGRRSGAVGFAVYLDTVGQYHRETEEYDVDTVLVYGEKENIAGIGEAVQKLSENGDSVMAVAKVPDGIKYRKKAIFDGRTVRDDE